MTPETKFKRRLKKHLESLGFMVLPIAAGPWSRPGVPDWFVTHHRIGGSWVEVKVRPNTMTDAQGWTVEELRKRGTPAHEIALHQDGSVWVDGEERPGFWLATVQSLDPGNKS